MTAARALAILVFAATPALWAQGGVEELLEQKTLQRLRDFDARFDGVLGVAAVDLANGHVFSYHGDAVFTQASSIKIPVLIEIFKAQRAGELRLSDRVMLLPRDMAGGSGTLAARLAKGEALTLTVEELVRHMIVESDNTAANKLIDMAGMERVNRTLESLGLAHTRLRRKMMDDAAVERGDENVSTPLEMARLAALLYSGRIIDEKACREMLAVMKQVKAAMRAAVPSRYEVAAKPGGVDGVRCETGIVYLDRRPFALSVMSVYDPPKAEDPVGPVTRIVFDHFERLAHSNRYGHRFAPVP